MALNLDRAYIIQFKTNNTPQYDLCIGYDEKYIKESINTKFLGLQIDNHLNWKNHIDQIVPQLSGACYAIRSMSHVSNTVTLKVIYFAYFHSIMNCGIIFWGNSSSSKTVFTLQKNVIRIIAGVKPRNSCRNLFKRLEILHLPCEYIFSLMNFIVKNQELFQTNSAVHSVNTRNKHQLHRPTANLSCFQKSAFYTGIKIFNSLPSSLTSLVNKKSQFKVALKIYLNTHSFYSVDEFIMFENDS
jgi:IS1 family transposase